MQEISSENELPNTYLGLSPLSQHELHPFSCSPASYLTSEDQFGMFTTVKFLHVPGDVSDFNSMQEINSENELPNAYLGLSFLHPPQEYTARRERPVTHKVVRFHGADETVLNLGQVCMLTVSELQSST
jgi:hypothetical protein